MELKKIRKYEHKWIIIFSIIIFFIYLMTLSCSFDDEDSILFIKGVKEFNVAKYQPHPPGYPVYIFLGKISHFFITDELLSLTILSAIFGALSIIVFYFLIFKMYNRKIAIMSAMIMAVTPLFWLNSLKAMTDMTALFFILLSLYFLYGFVKDKKVRSLYIGAFVSAIATGVRFHAFFVVVPLLIYCFFKVKNKKKFFYAVEFFLCGVLVWFIPLILSNGFQEYFKAALNQFLRRFDRHGMATVGGELSLGYLIPRAKSFFRFFVGAGYGIDLEKLSILPVISSLVYLFFLLLSFEGFKGREIKGKSKFRNFIKLKFLDERIVFFVIGLFFYILMVLLFLPPHNPRYFLPLIPFISLLFALGVSWFGRLNYIAFAVLFVLLIFYSFPLAIKIHEVPSSPVQLVSYIKTNYNMHEILIFRSTINKGHLNYYGLDSYGYEKLKTNNSTNFSSENKTLIFVSPERKVIRDYNATLIEIFTRDFRIHSKQSKITLYKTEELEKI